MERSSRSRWRLMACEQSNYTLRKTIDLMTTMHGRQAVMKVNYNVKRGKSEEEKTDEADEWMEEEEDPENDRQINERFVNVMFETDRQTIVAARWGNVRVTRPVAKGGG